MSTPRLRFAPSPDRLPPRRRRAHRAASTGCTRGSTAASSCCASRTPTRRAAPTRARARSSTGSSWLGLDWDEDVVHQGANLERHQRDARALLERGAAYRCFCTAAELDERRAAKPRRAGEALQVRSPLRSALAARSVERRVARRRAVRDPLSRARGHDGVGRPRARAHRVPEQGHRGLRHPPLRRHADLQHGGRVRRHRDAASRSSCAATITSRTRRSRSCCTEALGAPLPRFAHLPMIHGTRRQEAEQAARRDRGRRLPAPRHPARRDGSTSSRCSAGRPAATCEVMTLRRDDRAASTPTGCSKKAAIFDPEEARVDERPAPERTCRSESLEPLITPPIVAAGLATAAGARGAHAVVSTALELLRVRARTIDDFVRQAAPYFRESSRTTPDAVAKQWKDGGAGVSSRRRASVSPRARGMRRRWRRRCASWRSVAASRRASCSSRCASPSREALRAPASSTCCCCWAVRLSLRRLDAALSTLGA